MFSKAIALCSEICTKHINRLCRKVYPETLVNFYKCRIIAQAISLPPLEPGFDTCLDHNVICGGLSSTGAGFLLRIREFPCSDLDQETGYSDWGFSWFSSVPADIWQDSDLQLGHDSHLPGYSQFIICLSSYHSALNNHWSWSSGKGL
jgi:hypothetical protein